MREKAAPAKTRRRESIHHRSKMEEVHPFAVMVRQNNKGRKDHCLQRRRPSWYPLVIWVVKPLRPSVVQGPAGCYVGCFWALSRPRPVWSLRVCFPLFRPPCWSSAMFAPERGFVCLFSCVGGAPLPSPALFAGDALTLPFRRKQTLVTRVTSDTRSNIETSC